jgi:DNA (cytosine-5)-methyltransferase 1
MGGLALGFARNGFRVIGYDIHPRVPEIFEINRIGLAVTADLTDPASIRPEHREAQVVTGGPPCRPWSALNLHRRGSRHPDHPLLRAFFRAVREISPEAFLMENVPRLSPDPAFQEILRDLAPEYDMRLRVIRYSDFAAATARHRLILVGFRRPRGDRKASQFFRRL